MKVPLTVEVLCGAALVGMSAVVPLSPSAPLPVIAFVSSRDTPDATQTDPQRAFAATEIYLMDVTGMFVRRVTNNTDGDGFPALSPDGTRIVFDSTRRQASGDPFNVSDLFVMKSDGTDQQFLIRGSSATWSPDGRRIAFHASASGTGKPIKADPGAAATDSDIFILEVSDGQTRSTPRNLTKSPAAIDDDASWSPDGKTIVFTSHDASDDPINSATAEIYAENADGTGSPRRLTRNAEEERGPSWSPDGKRLVFSCRRGGPDFEICIMNADGTSQRMLTDNTIADLTPTWSPDGKSIVFHRRVGEPGRFQLFMIDVDGAHERQLTFPPGINAFPNWGVLRTTSLF